MDYGEIFTGTFSTIWRHKRLWLFGLLGWFFVTLGGALYGWIALSAVGPWLETLRQLAQSGAGRAALPAEIGNFLARLAGGIALFLLFWLISYIVNLIMRGATIHEAGAAWSGRGTDTGRGLREGGNRALHLFGLDLIWYVPVWIIGGSVFAGLIAAWIASITALATGRNANGGAAGAAILGFCGLVCCLLVLGVLVAAFLGTFAPLTYQAAVQGRRSLGAALAEGWHLARTHAGPMLIFWLLLLLLAAACGLLSGAVNSLLSLSYRAPWMEWAASLAQQGGSPATVIPPLPPLNTGVMAAAVLTQALISLLLASFIQTFRLTMYAEVYRRLAGVAAPAGAVESLPPGRPPETAGGARVYDTPLAGAPGGATRVYDAPPDPILTVGDETGDVNDIPPAA